MLIVSPTAEWLNKAAERCSCSLSISSPYVGKFLHDLAQKVAPQVRVKLLTRTLLLDFASGASDLEAVIALSKRCELSGHGFGVSSLSSLHAKVYLIDDKHALVTSANATFSGMYRNRECGIAVDEPNDVRELTTLVESGFGSTSPPRGWTFADLETLRQPVEALKSTLPATLRSSRHEQETGAPSRVELRSSDFNRFLGNVQGWTRLALEGMARIKADQFGMAEMVQACEPLVRERYPNNQHPREKLRQQLQVLRDLGLVLFLERGRYERLTRLK